MLLHPKVASEDALDVLLSPGKGEDERGRYWAKCFAPPDSICVARLYISMYLVCMLPVCLSLRGAQMNALKKTTDLENDSVSMTMVLHEML